MENRELSEVFNQEKDTERQEVLKASDAVVKPDTRTLPPSRQGKKTGGDMGITGGTSGGEDRGGDARLHRRGIYA